MISIIGMTDFIEALRIPPTESIEGVDEIEVQVKN